MSQDNKDGRPIDYERDEPRREKRDDFKPPPAEEDDGLVRIHIEPCPCGKQPTMLMLELDADKKRGHVFGDCCSEWMVEFNNNYNVDKDKMAERAKAAWNRAPRVVSS